MPATDILSMVVMKGSSNSSMVLPVKREDFEISDPLKLSQEV